MAAGRLGNGSLAWDEWRKNSMQVHSEVYPSVASATWSGPDVIQSVMAANPGEAGIAYGLQNAWAHTLAVSTLPDLVGKSRRGGKQMTLWPSVHRQLHAHTFAHLRHAG
jgi:hypothetical protein